MFEKQHWEAGQGDKDILSQSVTYLFTKQGRSVCEDREL